MLAAQRLADLRRMARQLQRLRREVDTRRVGASAALSTAAALPASPVLHAKSDGDSSAGVDKLRGVQEKLLFRRVPVCVSLLERSFVSFQRRLDRRRAAPPTEAGDTLPPLLLSKLEESETRSGTRDALSHGQSSLTTLNRPAAASHAMSGRAPVQADERQAGLVAEAIRLLYVLEKERRALRVDRRTAAAGRVARATAALNAFTAEFASTRQARGRRLHADETALLQETKAMLMERVRAADAHAVLLERSLLSRPLLSARMWRLLLAERVWVAAVSRQRSGAGEEAEPAQRLLPGMALLFARLVLGVTKDYVEGSELNRWAPRFAVSLPSAASPAQQSALTDADATKGGPTPSGKAAAADESNGAVGEADVLAWMLAGDRADPPASAAAQVSSRAAPETPALTGSSRRSPRAKRSVSLGWMPPRSADLYPLLAETLALYSFVLPELDAGAIVRQGHALELVSLLTALQSLATAALALSPVSTDAFAALPPWASQQLHSCLHRLEHGIVHAGRTTVVELCGCVEPAADSRSSPYAALAPVEAAQLIISLDKLKLFASASRDTNGEDAARAQRDALGLLEYLLQFVFPELKTNTPHVLGQKARQNSLFAFATKRHKEKLTRTHGGRAAAEKFVLGTTVQRARLEQRRMVAALREQHLTSVHLQAVTALGRAVPAPDLLALFRLLASSAATPLDRRGGLQSSRLVTASLFLMEALLVSGALAQSPDAPARDNGVLLPVGLLTLDELLHLWVSLSLLWPIIDTRRELRMQQARQAHSSSATEEAHTETAITGFATEAVLSAVNAYLTQQLDTLADTNSKERASPTRQSVSAARSSTAAVRLSAEHLATIGLGLLSWCEADASVRRRRGAALEQRVHLAQTLVRELLRKDHSVWHEVRAWDPAKRDRFERRMTECLHTAELLDTTTQRAIRTACSVL